MALIVVCATLLAASQGVTDGARPPDCLGATATIIANRSAQVTEGTSGEDVIVGTPDGDHIRGRGGADTICAGAGDDVVRGGSGGDRISLGPGDDVGRGGGGDDVVAGGPGSDELIGGRGHDTLNGGRGGDVLRGGARADTLFGNAGPDELIGGRGTDRCAGGPGADEVSSCNERDCVRHVSVDGRNDGAGTAADPWATITHAVETVPDAHCVIVADDGVHRGTVDVKRRFSTSVTIVAATFHGAVLESRSAAIDIDGARNVTFNGFEIRHVEGGEGILVSVSGRDDIDAENITFRNSLIHDSYDNDLMKVNHGVRNVLVENTISYNPGPKEHHYDINGVADVTLRNNIMFNDYAGSGRTEPLGKMFVIIKDSNSTGLDFGGSKRITLDGNVFIGWAVGGGREPMIKAGNDGKPYHEAVDVVFENNLFLSNGPDEAWTVFGAAGVRGLVIRNNTVNGVEARYPGYRLEVKEDNPANEDVTVCNNVWSSSDMEDFEKVTGPVDGLSEHHNLYWNNGHDVPDFDPSDGRVADPELVSAPVQLPRSGDARVWLPRLVAEHGTPGGAVVDIADPGCASTHDILGRGRGGSPDVGAVEVSR